MSAAAPELTTAQLPDIEKFRQPPEATGIFPSNPRIEETVDLILPPGAVPRRPPTMLHPERTFLLLAPALNPFVFNEMLPLTHKFVAQGELGWGIVVARGPECKNPRTNVGQLVFFPLQTAVRFAADEYVLTYILDECNVMLTAAPGPGVRPTRVIATPEATNG